MNPIAEDILQHVGMPRRSGRYPWGSGKETYQRTEDFLARIDNLRKEKIEFTDEDGKHYSGDTAIAKIMGLTTTKFRTQESLAKSERRSLLVDTAQGLREKGYSLNEIAEKMGYKNDSSVRSLLNEKSKDRMESAYKTADFLKAEVDAHGMVDVGSGTERHFNMSPEKLKQALYILELEGYPTWGGGTPQVTNKGKQINLKVLCPPGTEHKEIFAARDAGEIHYIRDSVTDDGGETFRPTWVYPKSMDSRRLKINYADDGSGGGEKDGTIELRRGVKDLSLGDSRYSQVRILVDDKHYIKGMAVYSDNMPPGVDVVFNTNKKSSVPKLEVLKKISNDPDNPFGALIKPGVEDPSDPASPKKGGQRYYIDKNGNKQLSLINKRADEGDWGEWNDALPSQFLSKQSLPLIKKQLGLAVKDKQVEFDEIMSLENPTLKKVLLKSFSDDCDTAAVHLQAAALPRQKYQVIMPIPSLKDTEVFAPRYHDGEDVALIRFPHAGQFEIPILKVNNKQEDARKIFGTTPTDVVGINSRVAQQLSGADFDGDTVMVLPIGKNKGTQIRNEKPIKELQAFDPKKTYGPDKVETDATGKEHYFRNGKEYKVMSSAQTQNEMGIISNLITDMTLLGATDEKVRAVKHSMVVIDAEKHKLDYKSSYTDNNIAALKRRYQGRYENGRYKEGAATLISKAKSPQDILKTKGNPNINQKGKPWYDPSKPEGALIYKHVEEEYKVLKYVKDPITGKKIINPETGKPVRIDTGKTKKRMQRSSKMAETSDAFTLISKANTPQEIAYAEYANRMKEMGNEARRAFITTHDIKYNKEARAIYQAEVDSLIGKLNVAETNRPREREANVIANSVLNIKKAANPDMTAKEIKKLSQQELTRARDLVGAKRTPVQITSDREWEAIQSGAISPNQLTKILNNTDIDALKARATPRAMTSLSVAQTNRIKRMSSSYTTAQIAKALGVSVSTVSKYLNERGM